MVGRIWPIANSEGSDTAHSYAASVLLQHHASKRIVSLGQGRRKRTKHWRGEVLGPN